MRFLTTSFLVSILLFSFHASAKPELAPAALLDFGSYEKVEEMTIYGDIQQDILTLAQNNTSESDADLFVIDDINEDIDLNLVMVTISLYNDLNDGLVMR
ncbi:hypothetical protein A1OO_13700 [Enterovibrio norvegicus FF-33]|uniref:Uncharacterized protein n=1 Tax=Enterovibrio norvegicus FF-454 TaxID=1185651 RepID=A0A1E5CBL1_9GAMM|nr:hypothetical protein [Enterovibrio norvegicus]OEE62891.1 hypothetical protein A1OK_20120 [Enterovibrio norvegicus FF-454]OEE66815.1 hypothetical protein A1OO_13700 [Enterovibrio norvegicus FF-33]OEE76548.1 hypothetical protein A1OQ_05990 [Enterovibrio norvegicus FF-162]